MRTRRVPICALVSGGLDSAVLLHRLLEDGHPVLPLYLRCGFRWERAEVYWLRRFLAATRAPRRMPIAIIDLPLRSVYGAHWSLTGRRIPGPSSPDSAVYLPGRNLLLISAAALVCVRRRISTIALGILKGNPFGDASPRFFAQLAASLSEALGRPLRILSPIARVSKAQLLCRAQQLPLALTFSCLNPRGRFHCGRCNKCAERQRAFRLASVPDLTRYA
ncbi:MAG: 7-cyano-7-deazaguanine synthase [Candidatus Omnitrophota bacterium]|nr:7-cyano-7-deazaguanine synthase [Candidatus Omnitrophota bacterium]